MKAGRGLQATRRLLEAFRQRPGPVKQGLRTLPDFARGCALADGWIEVAATTSDRRHPEPSLEDNPLWSYFSNNLEGPGIYKWEHYFEIYHRHLARFVGAPLDMVEIGILGGGSLGMWSTYFGAQARIHGVDVEEACRVYESENVSVHIGDQEDRSFWRRFKQDVPAIDVLLDDGGHTPAQQMVTLEEMLPCLRPGGVYVCEDIHGLSNEFIAFCSGLVDRLNAIKWGPGPLATPVTSFQASVHSIHFYPYLLVIEKHHIAPVELRAPKHGTEWQPY